MRILLTNDDGIHAPGLLALLSQLSKIGRVTVVAPENERSSIGHAITLGQPIRIKKVFKAKNFFGYSVAGTPADCVKLALHKIMPKKPDLVVAGINPGANDGCSVHYSGTVAAAREGALNGILSMAFSIEGIKDPKFEVAARIAKKVVLGVLHEQVKKKTFLNINIPNKNIDQIKGMRVVRQSTRLIHSKFKRILDPDGLEYFWMTGKRPVKNLHENSDTAALNKGYVSIAPIQCDLTDDVTLSELNGCNF